jgi:hypothetical protein
MYTKFSVISVRSLYNMKYLIILLLCVSSSSYASDKPLKIIELADNVEAAQGLLFHFG